MEQVVAAVVDQLGGNRDAWQPGRRCDDISRAMAAYVARRTTSLGGREIAQALGYRNVSSITLASRRVESALRGGCLVEATAAILGRLATNH